jgi:hypothetical protein
MKVSSGSPESFGYQRRPDLDTPSGVAYEAPNGELILFPKDRKPELSRLSPGPRLIDWEKRSIDPSNQ